MSLSVLDGGTNFLRGHFCWENICGFLIYSLVFKFRWPVSQFQSLYKFAKSFARPNINVTNGRRQCHKERYSSFTFQCVSWPVNFNAVLQRLGHLKKYIRLKDRANANCKQYYSKSLQHENLAHLSNPLLFPFRN